MEQGVIWRDSREPKRGSYAKAQRPHYAVFEIVSGFLNQSAVLRKVLGISLTLYAGLLNSISAVC